MGSRYEWALFLHLVGVVSFFAGAAVAAAGLETARRRTNPAEIAQLLGLARVGVPLVGVGTALVLGSGVWLVDLGNWGWDGWIVAALGLLGASAAMGTAAGQWPKRARRLAGQLAAAGEPADDELDRLLSHRLSLALNYASAALGLVVLAVMVFKPGA